MNISNHRRSPVYLIGKSNTGLTLDTQAKTALRHIGGELTAIKAEHSRKDQPLDNSRPGGAKADPKLFHYWMFHDLREVLALDIWVTVPTKDGKVGKDGYRVGTAQFSEPLPSRPSTPALPVLGVTRLYDERTKLPLSHEKAVAKLRSMEQQTVNPLHELMTKAACRLLDRAIHIVTLADQYRATADVLVSDAPAAWDDHKRLMDIEEKWNADLLALGVDLTGPKLTGDLAPFMQSLVWPMLNGREIEGGLERAMFEDEVLVHHARLQNRIGELGVASSVVVDEVPTAEAVDTTVSDKPAALSRSEKKALRKARFAAQASEFEAAGLLATEAQTTEQHAGAVAEASAVELELGPSIDLEAEAAQAVVEPAAPVDTPVALKAAESGSGA